MAHNVIASIDHKRAQRDSLIAQTDWYVSRHRDQSEAGTETTLTPSQYSELLTYRQALRDWTLANNSNAPYPNKPSWM